MLCITYPKPLKQTLDYTLGTDHRFVVYCDQLYLIRMDKIEMGRRGPTILLCPIGMKRHVEGILVSTDIQVYLPEKISYEIEELTPESPTIPMSEVKVGQLFIMTRNIKTSKPVLNVLSERYETCLGYRPYHGTYVDASKVSASTYRKAIADRQVTPVVLTNINVKLKAE